MNQRTIYFVCIKYMQNIFCLSKITNINFFNIYLYFACLFEIIYVNICFKEEKYHHF